MREIVRSSAFKADYKREMKGLHRETLEHDLKTVLNLLVADSPLPRALQGSPAERRLEFATAICT